MLEVVDHYVYPRRAPKRYENSMSKVEVINKTKSLADYAYQHIRNDIINGQLAAGEKLRLEVLCKRYDIGMSPLREALARLIGDALVVSESQRGFWVAPLSLEELQDLAHVRALIETEALQLSITRGGEEWQQRMTESFEHLSEVEARLVKEGDEILPEWERANRAFHQTMVSECGSPWLIRMLKTLFQQTERYRRLSMVQHESDRSVHDEHTALYEAVMQKNHLKACRIAEMHLRRTTESVERVFQTEESDPKS